MVTAMNLTSKINNIKHWTLLILIFLYIIFVMLMSISGRFGITTKTVIVPFLFLAAFISKSGTKFIKDWSIYLSLVILFDSLRGLIYALVTYYELPIYLNYVLKIELILGCNKVYPSIFQDLLKSISISHPLNKFCAIIYGSHFFVFLIFGLIIWYFKYNEFRNYTLSMLMLMYSGALFYLLLPTIPPWMASNTFQAIAPIKHISSEIYNTNIATLYHALAINPIAAMPSLHAAFPTLLCLISWKRYKKMTWILIPYTILLFFVVIYLGDHYLVDVLAGIILALGVFSFVYHKPQLKFFQFKYLHMIKDKLNIKMRFKSKTLLEMITAAMFIVLISCSIGLLSNSIRKPLIVSPAFIEKELGDNNQIAGKFLFNYAYNYSKFKAEIDQTNKFLSKGKNVNGLRIIQDLTKFNRNDPEPYFWLKYFQLKTEALTKHDILVDIDSFDLFADKKRAKVFKNILKTTAQL